MQLRQGDDLRTISPVAVLIRATRADKLQEISTEQAKSVELRTVSTARFCSSRSWDDGSNWTVGLEPVLPP